MTAPAAVEPIWSLPLPELFQRLEAGPEGLGNEEALRRLQRHGPNRLHQGTRSGTALVLLRQFTSPIILILTAAALLSFVLDSPTDVLIILAIVLVSGLLGWWLVSKGEEESSGDWLRSVAAPPPPTPLPFGPTL